MSITNSSVLVELNISVWTASKLDRETTEDVRSANHADRDAVQVRKNLMAGTNLRKEISDYAAGCRLWHNTRTLPWADKGARLLPTSLFMDYKSEANVRRDAYNRLVDNFLLEYPQLIQTRAQHLGALFRASDYPSVDEVRSKFGFRLVFSPVPESGDFRLDVPQHDMDQLREEYEENFKDRLADAMREPWDRLHKLLTGMSEKLVESGDDVKKRYHDTFITNAEQLCDLLAHLNVTKDPKLEQARRQLELTITGLDMEDIKESASTRADVKGRLDAILKQYDW